LSPFAAQDGGRSIPTLLRDLFQPQVG
jgi:hypothetical protein